MRLAGGLIATVVLWVNARMTENALQPSRDEAFRKLGRNLVLFQQLERRFKLFLTHCVVIGSTEENVAAFIAARAESLSRRTLGQLVGCFADQVLASGASLEDERTCDLVPSFRFSFQIQGDEYSLKRRQALADLVEERNLLVHHLLERFDLNSTIGVQELDSLLEEQAERVRAALNELHTTALNFVSCRQEIARFLGSAEGVRLMELMWLQSSRIVQLLSDIAPEIARPDGWSVLDRARGLLNERAPDELATMRSRYGHRTLSALLQASEIFDALEEPTARGGTRILFRPTPGRCSETRPLNNALPPNGEAAGREGAKASGTRVIS